MTRRVGSQNPDAGLFDRGAKLLLQILARMIDLGKATGSQHHGSHTFRRTIPHRLRCLGSRQHDDPHIDTARQRRNGLGCLEAADIFAARIDRMDRALKAVGDHILDDRPAGSSRRGGRADNSNAFRIEKGFQGCHA